MNIFKWGKAQAEQKASDARITSTINVVGQAQASPAQYTTYSQKGYGANTAVYACVTKIAEAVGGISWVLYSKRKGGQRQEIEAHDLLTLLDRPNPMQGTAAFFKGLASYYLLAGNSYIEAVGFGGKVQELWTWRPDKISIIPGNKGYPAAYVYKDAGSEKRWNVNFIDLKSQILHLKTFDPENLWYGQAPLKAGLVALDSSNAGGMWNLAMLQNAATPSGVLTVQASPGNPAGTLDQTSFERLKDQIAQHMGFKKAGKPMLLEGGLKWEQISLSPKDMEFLKGKEVSASDIALIFGVPAEMLGLGQKTYNNYEEARLAFYQETVLPFMDFLKTELNRWLVPAFGDDLELDYDKDDIEALTYQREKKFATVKDANFLTQNEKREMVGYEAKPGWDVFMIGQQLVANPEDLEKPTAPGAFGGDPEDEETDPPDDDKKPPKKKPKKPPVDDDEEGNAIDNTEKSMSFKTFNPITKNDRKRAYAGQNARKTRLEKPFQKDVEHELNEMVDAIVEAGLKHQDPTLAQNEMFKAIDDSMVNVSRTISKNIGFTLRDFGQLVFEDAKENFPEYVETKATRKFDDYVKRYIKTRTGNAITKIEETSRKKVVNTVKRLTQAAITDGASGAELSKDIMRDLSTSLKDLSPARARVIARTEVQLASQNGSLEAVKSMNIPNMEKGWVTANDDRVRDDDHVADHAHMNDEWVGLDEKFLVPPDCSMEGPGDPSAPAEQVIQCRCCLIYRSRN